MVTDMSGDAEADPDRVLGLFYRDVRHLSRWRLTVDGSPLQPLSTGASGYPAATFFLAGLGGNVYADPIGDHHVKLGDQVTGAWAGGWRGSARDVDGDELRQERGRG